MKQEALKVLILGYGAREHALAWKVAQSPIVSRIFVAPGNAGTAQIACNLPLSDEDIPALVEYALTAQIDLTIVGTNDPLAFGVVDAFQAVGLAIFGPTQAASRLESSKAFAKAFMCRHHIPTPTYATFTDHNEAVAYIDSLTPGGVVVKVSGLGKMGMGVTVCDNRRQAKRALRRYMVEQTLGDAASTIIIEQRLHGGELSVFALSDGVTAVGPDLESARLQAYAAARKISFAGAHYRHDVGKMPQVDGEADAANRLSPAASTLLHPRAL